MLLRRGLLVIGLVLLTRPAFADEKERCFSAYESVQRERKGGHLVRASEMVQMCLEPSCPAALHADCETWRREIDRELPSFVVDLIGGDATGAIVTVDGIALTVPFPEPKPLDPGEHHVRVVANGATRERTFTLAQGQKAARITIDVPVRTEPTPPRREDEEGAPLPTSFWIASGVAAAGLVSFGVFGALGRSRHGELEDTCGTRCSQSSADGVSRLYLVADISLAVAIVSSGVAGFLFFTRSPAKH